MSGTDVAQDQETDNAAEQPKSKGAFLPFLKIWLPFPLILGGILFFYTNRTSRTKRRRS